MATGYIVWDSKNFKVIAGPFPSSANATTHLTRAARHYDSTAGPKSSKDQSAQFTIETVTV